MAPKHILGFLLLLVLIPDVVISKRYPPINLQNCAEGCHCRNVDCLKEKKKLYCREVDVLCINANVTHRLTELPENTTRLTITGENMSHTTLDIFSRFTALKILNLPNNTIRSLKISKQFRGLDFLNLDNNRLCYLPLKGLGKLLPTLKILKVQHNNLTFIHDISFPARLIRLDLANNYIRSPKKGSFRRLKRLEILSLANNSIAEIFPVAFRHLLKLQTLDLDNNSISVIPANAFAYLPSLSFLSLRYNKIEIIQPKAFRQIGVRWHGQHQIRLEFNLIRILREESIEVLFVRREVYSIYLAGNPIFCDCGLMLIRDKAADMFKDSHKTFCESPAVLKESTVDELQFIGCVETEEDDDIYYNDLYYDDDYY